MLLNYELNLTESLEESFDEEFRTTYFHENMRVSQIRRVIAITMMRKQEISTDRMAFFTKMLKSTKMQVFDYNELIKLFDARNEYSAVNPLFLQTIMSLSLQEGKTVIYIN